ncbi:MAG: DNA primase catalytic subunit PriS [Candidatus Micrarchaeota archaeon]|nr:DNA primase catalytic subunit PriS [Candidatus Micrarchaeota archaeon]
MNEKEIRFALERFRNYYQQAEFDIVQIDKREFGIGNIKKIDARHLAFTSEDAFRSYLMNNTPLFVSHSTAYYRYPGATPIEKKEWGGADVVFDLDIHAEGKYGVYAKLEQVKNDAIKLIEDFLLSDFGISKNDLLVVFSGNRGYHVHVRDRNFLDLGSDERRELVDYIRGAGLNYRNFFEENYGGIKGKINGPEPSDYGYRGKFARAVLKLLENEPEKISRKFTKETERNMFKKGIENGNWSTSLSDIIERVGIVASELPLHTVDTDAGVTFDTSKLIRVPNSIHGETGFVAKIVKDLDSFNPFRDATLKLKGELKVKFTEDVPVIQFGDETIGPFVKEREETLGEAQALFFILKGSAVILG